MKSKYYQVELYFENPWLSGWKLFGTWKFNTENDAYAFVNGRLKKGQYEVRAFYRVLVSEDVPKSTVLTSDIINT